MGKNLIWFDELEDKEKLFVVNDLLYVLMMYVNNLLEGKERVDFYKKVMLEEDWDEEVEINEVNGLVIFYEKSNIIKEFWEEVKDCLDEVELKEYVMESENWFNRLMEEIDNEDYNKEYENKKWKEWNDRFKLNM